MTKNRIWPKLTVYSFAHFVVDFTCAFLMFRYLSGTAQWYECMLYYNFCAFALQMPLGVVADWLNRNALFSAVGCGLAAAAFALTGVPVLCAVMAGVGNGMFHVGGGVDVLNISRESSGPLGVFVSPGALGIFLGTALGRGGSLPSLWAPLTLVLVAGLILWTRYRVPGQVYPGNAPLSLAGLLEPGAVPAVACLFLVVCLRSYVGMTLNFSWKGTGAWALVLVLALALGKTAGGLLADKLGPWRTALASLLGAAALFLLPDIPVAGVGAVLLFNMTMPLTLWAVARILPGAKGFSFGLLTFGLFAGFLPVYLGAPGPAAGMGWFFAAAALASLALLAPGLRGRRE